MPEGLNVCMNYEFNLLHLVGVVAKRVCAAAAAAAAETAHEGDNNTPSGPTGQGQKLLSGTETPTIYSKISISIAEKVYHFDYY